MQVRRASRSVLLLHPMSGSCLVGFSIVTSLYKFTTLSFEYFTKSAESLSLLNYLKTNIYSHVAGDGGLIPLV